MVALTAAQRKLRRLIGTQLAQDVSYVAGLSDPGEREDAASRFVPAAVLEGPDELLADLLDIVAEAPGGPDVLAAMSTSAPTPIAVRARGLLDELEDPPAALGRLTVEQAWLMDAHEPVYGIFLLCAREGADGRQMLSFTIETLLSEGAVKDGFVTGTTEGDRFVKKLTGRLPEDVPVESLEPVEAAARVVAAAEQGGRSGLSPTQEGLTALTIFLRASQVENADAIVQTLELGAPLADRIDELEDEARQGVIAELAEEAHEWFREQGFDQERSMAGGFAVGLMGDFRAFYLDEGLFNWKARELDAFLLEWVPTKVSLDEAEIDAFPASVVDTLAFLAATGRLEERKAGTLSARVRRNASRFAAEMADSANKGPARAIFDAMTAEGVDVGDPDALQTWLDDFNARPFEERDQVLGPVLPPPTRPSHSADRSKAKARKAQKKSRRGNRGR